METVPDPESMSEVELRRALKKMLVDTSRCRTREDLIAKFRIYATPAASTAPALGKQTRPRVNPAAADDGSAPLKHGTFIDGRYVAPPKGPLDSVGGWKVVLIVVLASGWFFSSGPGASDSEADAMGVRPHVGSYSADDIALSADGKVLDITSHSQFLGAIAYHWDTTNLPVVVDFYGAHCGPCRAFAAVFDQLAVAFKGKAVFLKVNTGTNPSTSTLFGVRGLPTFMFFAHGRMHGELQFSGADQNRLMNTASKLADETSSEGTYVQRKFTASILTDFLEKLDADKPDNPAGVASQLLADYTGKPARIARYLKSTYGSVPRSIRTKTPITADTGSGWLDTLLGIFGFDTRNEDDEDGDNLMNDVDETVRDPDAEEIHDEEEISIAGVRFSSTSFYGKTPRSKHVEQVVIVGGGPAGLSAAIYAARAGLKPIVIAPTHGGQLLGKGVGVENFPGIIGANEPASGEAVVQLMRIQAASFGTLFLNAKLTDSNLSTGSPFSLEIKSPNPAADPIRISTHAVILATGSNSRWLEVPGEDEFKGRGVTTCATCDGHLFRGKKVMVVGGGDTAMEDALVLARTSESVTVVHRRSALRASKILADRVLAHDKITVKWNTAVKSFQGNDEGLREVVLVNVDTDEESRLPVSAAFVAIGHIPNSHEIRQQVKHDDTGYVWVEPGSTQTSVPGVFACGDVADKVYRQAVTSAGAGAMAALDAERWLSTRGAS